MSNENASSSAYMVDSIDTWHDRLGHINFSYIKKMKEVGLIRIFSSANVDICQIYIESKITKKSCKSVEREIYIF